jgi:hypothetical protein
MTSDFVTKAGGQGVLTGAAARYPARKELRVASLGSIGAPGSSAARMSPGPAAPALLLYFATQSTPTLPSRKQGGRPQFTPHALACCAWRSEIKEERQRQLPRGTSAEPGTACQRTAQGIKQPHTPANAHKKARGSPGLHTCIVRRSTDAKSNSVELLFLGRAGQRLHA